tara:strand:- start:211 stop:402 length:192 start_codon:yes stop_codon:yes gene_type:complete
MSIPYAKATSGDKARIEITRILQSFGCESIGFLGNSEDKPVVLAFVHRAPQATIGTFLSSTAK